MQRPASTASCVVALGEGAALVTVPALSVAGDVEVTGAVDVLLGAGAAIAAAVGGGGGTGSSTR